MRHKKLIGVVACAALTITAGFYLIGVQRADTRRQLSRANDRGQNATIPPVQRNPFSIGTTRPSSSPASNVRTPSLPRQAQAIADRYAIAVFSTTAGQPGNAWIDVVAPLCTKRWRDQLRNADNDPIIASISINYRVVQTFSSAAPQGDVAAVVLLSESNIDASIEVVMSSMHRGYLVVSASMRWLASIVVAVCVAAALPLVAVGIALGGELAQATSQEPPSALATKELPLPTMQVDLEAAESCIGIPWQLLAAINLTADPNVMADIDLSSGLVTPPVFGPSIPDPADPGKIIRSIGPMAFAPSVWATYQTPRPGAAADTAPNPQNDYDAIATLANALCSLESSNSGLENVLLSYDASPSWEQTVWTLAVDYGMNVDGTSVGGPTTGSPSTAVPSGSSPPAAGVSYPISYPAGKEFSGSGTALVAQAEAELGVPYVWGGVTAHVGLDCSGLVVVSMAGLGINLLPDYRTSEEQATLGQTVSVNDLVAGDLLFFVGDDGSVATPLGHVAIYVGGGLMIEAPETGEDVKFTAVPWDAIEIARRVLK